MADINVMEVIWEAAQKGDDGSLHYPPVFIDFLWDCCFVDAKVYPLNIWRAAFEPFKQSDGHYKLSKEEFLSLDKYRYKGEVKIPFDPTKINEGKYTDEGFNKLVELSIEPSCGLPTDDFKKFLESLKNEFRQEDDLILIQAQAKIKISQLLEDYPSPLRRLELFFDDLLQRAGSEKKAETVQQQVSRTATPQELAALQQSTFIEGEASFAEGQARKLKEVAKSKELGSSGAGGEPLKNIKRSKKGLRG